MASVADICNLALSHLGSFAQITSISPVDGTVEAGYCARFYPIARKEMLEAGSWTWSKTRVALAPVTNPSLVWQYAYALPADCIDAKRVLQKAYVQQLFVTLYSNWLTYDELQMFTEQGSADFEVEDGVLLTNEPDAVLLYTRDVTDTTKFSTAAVIGLSYLLGSYLAGPIIKGLPGAQTSATMRKAAMNVIGEAAADDANQSSESSDFIPKHIGFRG
jgi:hypothetical protein